MQYAGMTEYRHDAIPALGVLLANVGTPDAPTPAALRKYLKQFLWDPRVIEPPPARWLWWLILNGIILNTRPKKSARLYANIWTPEGSPLLTTARRQAAGIEERLRARLGGPVHVAVGMGYGSPSIANALNELKTKHCRRVIVLPLFPQYSSATTGSVFDGVAKALTRERWIPELRFVFGYHDEPGLIEALANSVREIWARDGEPEKLLISFHGLPRRYFLAGDPYHCLCQKTGRLLIERLGLREGQYQLCFQSRFGREPWLQPYTDETLEKWGREGIRKVDVISPGFSADCLETLEELAITNREIFEHAAPSKEGLQYRYIPCLNDRDDHLNLLCDVIERNAAGWNAGEAEYAEKKAEEQAGCTRARHEAMARDSPNKG